MIKIANDIDYGKTYGILPKDTEVRDPHKRSSGQKYQKI